MPGQPASAVVAGGTLRCGHAGEIAVAAVSPRLTVHGRGVLLLGQEVGLPYLPAVPPPPPGACLHLTTDNPPKPAPCVTKAAVAGSPATKLTVGGLAVLLATTTGTTTTPVPNAAPPTDSTWSVSDPGQTRLRAL